MFKRALSLLLVLTMLVPTVISVSASSLPFTDVAEDHAYYDAIEYVYQNGIMNGTSSTEFGCDLSLNRAMLVTILYRLSESDDLIAPEGFTDVPKGSFYYYAVGWGQYHGIINGFDETTFGPSITVTTQQLVTFLYRYADSYEYQYYNLPEPDIIEQFYDYSSIMPFAQDAANWAVNCGIIPSTYTYFSPNLTVTRALCAEYLYKFITLAFGDSKALVSEPFKNCWYGDTICALLNQAGYEAYAQSNLTPLSVQFAFYNNDIVYVSCHGMDEYICLRGGNLYYTDFERNSLAGYELAYISACYAGGTFTKYLSDYALVNYAVGFTTETAVEPSYLDWGVNKFDRLFFEFYTDPVDGGDVQSAIDSALAEFFEYDQEQYGIDSVVCYH